MNGDVRPQRQLDGPMPFLKCLFRKRCFFRNDVVLELLHKRAITCASRKQGSETASPCGRRSVSINIRRVGHECLAVRLLTSSSWERAIVSGGSAWRAATQRLPEGFSRASEEGEGLNQFRDGNFFSTR